MPPDTAAAPRNPGVRRLDGARRGRARGSSRRMQEVFAGFTEHTDAQIGRLVEFLETRDKMRDTLFVVLSDNGASGEGGEYGSVNEYRYFLGLPDSLEENLAGDRRARRALDPQPLSGRLGAGGQYAAEVLQEVHVRRRHSGASDRPLAGRARRCRRAAAPVPPRDRPRADRARSSRASRRRAATGASSRFPCTDSSLAYTFVEPEAASPARHPVFRDGRPARDLSRRLEGGDEPPVRRRLRERPLGALRPARATIPRASDLAARPSPERLRSPGGSLVAGGRALRRPAARRPGAGPRLRPRSGDRQPATFTLLPGTRLLTPVTGPNFSMRSFRITAHADRASARATKAFSWPMAGAPPASRFSCRRTGSGSTTTSPAGIRCYVRNPTCRRRARTWAACW